MWPTFFIPLMSIQDGGDPDVEVLCGTQTTDAFNRTLVVPTPVAIEAGHLHLVFLSFETNNTIAWPTWGGPWHLVFDSVRHPTIAGTSWGTNKQIAAVRTYNGTDPDFTASVPGGFLRWAYSSIILKNHRAADPFLTGFAVGCAEGIHEFASNRVELSRVRGARPRDLMLTWSSPASNITVVTDPDASDVEFVCKNAVGSTGHIIAGAYLTKKASNLLTHSRTLNASTWAAVGLTRSSNVSFGGSVVETALAQATGTTRHYTEQSVELEAGKTYCLAVAGGTTDLGSQQTSIHLTYVKPDNTEHGVGIRGAGSYTNATWRVNAAGSEIEWGDDPGPGFIADVPSTFNLAGGLLHLPIICTVSGTYKIRINVGVNLPVTDPTTAQAGNANAIWYHSDIVLQESNVAAQMPVFTPTEDDPILQRDAEFYIPPIWNYVNQSDPTGARIGSFVLRRNTTIPARPSCYLHAPGIDGRRFDFAADGLSLTSTRGRYYSTIRVNAIQSSHAVSRYLSAATKFYYEMDVTSFGSGGTDDDYFIGINLIEAGNVNLHYVDQPYKHPYQYGYSSTGKIYDSGTLVGSGYATWQIGDSIGAAIDFENWQIKFYRNGTLIETISIVDDGRRDGLFMAVVGLTGVNTYANEAQLSANFAGPFGGRKPSGFVAFDFDNELT